VESTRKQIVFSLTLRKIRRRTGKQAPEERDNERARGVLKKRAVRCVRGVPRYFGARQWRLLSAAAALQPQRVLRSGAAAGSAGARMWRASSFTAPCLPHAACYV
jgi:hypothetical protein